MEDCKVPSGGLTIRARLHYALAVALTWVVPTAVSSTAVGLRLAESAPPHQPTALGQALATTYAPILRLDSNEQLEPVDRSYYVASADLKGLFARKHGRDTRKLLSQSVTLAVLPTEPLPCPQALPPFDECNYYLHVRGLHVWNGVRAFRHVQAKILQRRNIPVVYWYYYDHESILRYWFFYVFNYFLNWHEGDWEQITIRLDPTTHRPEQIGYSSHGKGQSKAWAMLIRGKQLIKDNPIVYVARKSHANYFRTGLHPVPECKYTCNDRSDGAGLQLKPGTYSLDELRAPSYSGDYGSGNFLAGGVKRLGTGINVPDPLSSTREDPRAWLNATVPADDGSGQTFRP